jgi:hypothetical protein
MFKSELIGKEKTIGTLKQKVMKVTRVDKKSMDINDAKDFITSLMEGADKKFKQYKMMVRGLYPDGMWTIKPFDSPNLNLMDHDEYVDGKVASTSKFQKIFQMQVFITYSLK